MSDYIPPDLIRRIFVRLPVESLLRCTTVCKSWYDLITSSSFISSHLNNQEPRILISHKTRNLTSYSVYRDNQTFDKISDLYPPLGVPTDSYNVIDSFNGLYCLFNSFKDRILLWNPSMRKSRELFPKPRVVLSSYSCVGFCFLPTTNDYKIVRVSYEDTEVSPPDVEIYELKINTWRSLDARNFPYIIPRRSKQAVLNGILHWVARDTDMWVSHLTLIGTFDMKNENFSTLILPDCCKNEIFGVYTVRESLCLAQCGSGFLSIWVMKEYGVADSWENQYTFDMLHDISLPLCFRENGDFLALNVDEDPYFLISCDLKKYEMKNVGVSINKSRFLHVGSYVESLVFINSSNKVLKSRSEDDQDKAIKKVRIG